jgi:hypothetical protein
MRHLQFGRFLTLVAALALATPAASMAQAIPESDDDANAWWGLGLGAGALRFTCDVCATDRDLGPSLHAVVGTHARSNIRVGLEIGGWSHQDGDVRETVYRAGVVSHLYPKPGSGLHVLGGLGWVGYRAEEFGYDAANLSLGIGWDLPLSGGWMVGNTLTIDAASFGSLKNEDTAVARGVGLSLARFTVLLKRL